MLSGWLIFFVERARVDPAPPAVDASRLAAIAAELRVRLAPYAFAPGAEWQSRALALVPAAAALWRDELYVTLNAGSAAGIAGGLNVRFAAYAKRLALLYALARGRLRLASSTCGRPSPCWRIARKVWRTSLAPKQTRTHLPNGFPT